MRQFARGPVCAAVSPSPFPPSGLPFDHFEVSSRKGRKDFPILSSFFSFPLLRLETSFLTSRVEKNVLFVLPTYVSIVVLSGYRQEKGRTFEFRGTSVSPAFPAGQVQHEGDLSCLSCQSPAKVLPLVASNLTEKGMRTCII